MKPREISKATGDAGAPRISRLARAEPAFAPALMPAPAAAHYLGVSESTLRSLGIPRRKLGAKRLFDRRDLDAYVDALPYDGEQVEDGASCEGKFGRGR